MKIKTKNSSGFTLIELLVVVAIIGLLSTLSLVALNGARQKSRDARRVSDVKQMQTALELYFNDQNTYPVNVAPGGSIASGTATYMALVPNNPDPKNDGGCPNLDYIYTMTNASSYRIRYCLGAATGGIPASTRIATPAGIANP